MRHYIKRTLEHGVPLPVQQRKCKYPLFAGDTVPDQHLIVVATCYGEHELYIVPLADILSGEYTDEIMLDYIDSDTVESILPLSPIA